MERRNKLRSKKLPAALAAGLLVLLSGALWLERTPLWVHYCVTRLRGAPTSDRQNWVTRVAALDLVAMPSLVDCLRRADARACANAQAALLEMVDHWARADGRRAELAACLAQRFAALSEQGQRSALEIQDHLVRAAATARELGDLLPAAAAMLAEASRTGSAEVQPCALTFAVRLLSRSTRPELINACRKLTLVCLHDPLPANRTLAIRLAVRSEIGTLDAIVPLLGDPAPEVRRAAILAIGSTPMVLSTDDLLGWLHDSDPGVRSLCEEALRSRGLEEEHLQLGRLMTDSRPGVRLQVVDRLRRATDLEPGVWLRRLSHDPAPAVRAAAVRAATEQEVQSLSDRLEQMAQNDACPSVRQLAQYYLTSQKSPTLNSTQR